MSDKETIEAMKAFGELAGLLKEGYAKTAALLEIMDKAASGEDALAYFVVVEKISELGEDDLISMLIGTTSILSRIRVKVKDDGRYEDLRELLGLKSASVESR